MSATFASIQFQSSQLFTGIVWKTLADEQERLIFVEVRDGEKKTVSFSALDVENSRWLWRDLAFDEKWWISLGWVHGGMLLFTIYSDTNNPDKKSVMAVDIRTKEIAWWKNNFVVAYVSGGVVVGQDTKFGSKEIALDLHSGTEVTAQSKEFPPRQNFDLVRPLQYVQGTNHFDTVKFFLERKCSLSPTHAVEYVEYSSLIVISAFEGQTDLANYLIVFNSGGEILLKEQLGENLKGIAYDTFFILSGFLIFVKNKRELISYRFV